MTFRTRPELAGEMVAGLRARGPLPARWALCDEGFGRDTALLDRLAAADLWYMAEVPHTTRVWTERPPTGVPAGTGQGRPRTRVRVDAAAPTPIAVAALAASLTSRRWWRYCSSASSSRSRSACWPAIDVEQSRNSGTIERI